MYGRMRNRVAHPRRSLTGRVEGLIVLLLFVAACAALSGCPAQAVPESPSRSLPASGPASAGPAQVGPQPEPARRDGITFDRLSVQDGLSQGTVIDLLQDHVGFMWFATEDGLNRYDGYGFRVYRHDPDAPDSLGHRAIWSLHEDREGWLDLLLVEWLSELLAQKDLAGLYYSRFRVAIAEERSGFHLDGRAWGEPLDPLRHRVKLEVKGVTYSGLHVVQEGERWIAQCVVDI